MNPSNLIHLINHFLALFLNLSVTRFVQMEITHQSNGHTYTILIMNHLRKKKNKDHYKKYIEVHRKMKQHAYKLKLIHLYIR